MFETVQSGRIEKETKAEGVNESSIMEKDTTLLILLVTFKIGSSSSNQ